jgi:hypothetical protein
VATNRTITSAKAGDQECFEWTGFRLRDRRNDVYGALDTQLSGAALQKEAVQYGRSDANADPCGNGTLLSWRPGEKHYKAPGLYVKRAGCPLENVRAKETDLITDSRGFTITIDNWRG